MRRAAVFRFYPLRGHTVMDIPLLRNTHILIAVGILPIPSDKQPLPARQLTPSNSNPETVKGHNKLHIGLVRQSGLVAQVLAKRAAFCVFKRKLARPCLACGH
jgi:hypothetical protein